MRVVSTYSYKGGAGRTLLLANLAVHLTKIGLRVVAIDLDLEAPGLHYKLKTAEPPKHGVVDLLIGIKQGTPVMVKDFLSKVEVASAVDGKLWMLPAGNANHREYWKVSADLDLGGWSRFDPSAPEKALDQILASCKDDLAIDVVLIDARTGVTEHNALGLSRSDHVLGVMVSTIEHVEGTLAVLESLQSSGISVSPVLSRVPDSQEFDHSGSLQKIDETIGALITKSLSKTALRLTHDPYLQEGERLALESWRRNQFGLLFSDYLGVSESLFPEYQELLLETARLRVRTLSDDLRNGAELPLVESELRELVEHHALPEARNVLAWIYRIRGRDDEAWRVLAGSNQAGLPALASEAFTEAAPLLARLVRQGIPVSQQSLPFIKSLNNLSFIPADLRNQVAEILARSET
jgi:MinD-like ATPase involved in chromosome partitioning or flagellar assembly